MQKLSYLLTCLVIVLNVYARQQVSIKVQDGSTITIDGSSNINRFTLTHTASNIPVQHVQLLYHQPNSVSVENSTISLPVRHFTTEDKMIQLSFYKMMKAGQYPTMHISLKRLDASDKKKGKVHTRAQVEISITGSNHTYEIPVETIITSQGLEIKGNKRISIKDFGISPPIAMMGMIRVSEWIDISMDLKCRMEILPSKILARQ